MLQTSCPKPRPCNNIYSHYLLSATSSHHSRNSSAFPLSLFAILVRQWSCLVFQLNRGIPRVTPWSAVFRTISDPVAHISRTGTWAAELGLECISEFRPGDFRRVFRQFVSLGLIGLTGARGRGAGSLWANRSRCLMSHLGCCSRYIAWPIEKSALLTRQSWSFGSLSCKQFCIPFLSVKLT